MPDYIYLLENRLSADQQSALRHLREAALEAGTILFLTGDAVRELTSGHSVRALESLCAATQVISRMPLSSAEPRCGARMRLPGALYLCFPGTVRVDLGEHAPRRVSQAGQAGLITQLRFRRSLRQRDFTVNAMAILQRGFVWPFNGPDERGCGLGDRNAATGIELWIPGGAVAADPGHALPGAAGLGDGSKDQDALRQRQGRGSDRASFCAGAPPGA